MRSDSMNRAPTSRPPPTPFSESSPTLTLISSKVSRQCDLSAALSRKANYEISPSSIWQAPDQKKNRKLLHFIPTLQRSYPLTKWRPSTPLCRRLGVAGARYACFMDVQTLVSGVVRLGITSCGFRAKTLNKEHKDLKIFTLSALCVYSLVDAESYPSYVLIGYRSRRIITGFTCFCSGESFRLRVPGSGGDV
ncbi:hypothetical protein CBL_03231 [Carabus blaptoides fortunei]